MSVKDQLATSLGRRDEAPNQELARAIAAASDREAVAELVRLLFSKDKNYQADALKTLYETGYLNPALIASHWQSFLNLLSSKNNRLVWGAMIALHTISPVKPDETFQNLSTILETADKGSVITRDAAVGILINLTGHEKFAQTTFPLLLDQLLKCPPNQLPMYAENAVGIVATPDQKKALAGVLHERRADLPKESQLKRLEKVLRKLEKIK